MFVRDLQILKCCSMGTRVLLFIKKVKVLDQCFPRVGDRASWRVLE